MQELFTESREMAEDKRETVGFLGRTFFASAAERLEKRGDATRGGGGGETQKRRLEESTSGSYKTTQRRKRANAPSCKQERKCLCS